MVLLLQNAMVPATSIWYIEVPEVFYQPEEVIWYAESPQSDYDYDI